MRCLVNGVGSVGFLLEMILARFATRVWSVSVFIVEFRCFTLWKLKRRREAECKAERKCLSRNLQKDNIELLYFDWI
nr:MAG TPA: hypothetical protein [Caudoviricetes sp.]